MAMSSQLISTSPYACCAAMATAAANTFQPRRTGVSGCSRRNPPRWRGASDDPQARRAGLAARGQPVAQPGGLGRDQPGDLRVGGGRGGVQLHGGQAEPAVQRAGGHVDELHPAVGHDDELAVSTPRVTSRSSARSA